MHKLPPIDYLQNTARSILAERDRKLLRGKLFSILQYYQAINYQLSYGWPLWRVRKCPSAEGFSRLSEVHYPPKPGAGRVNEPGIPMLYVCFNKFTAFQEVKASQGDFIHLIGYKQKEPILCCTIGEINNVQKSGRAITAEKLGNELNTILNGLSFETGASLVFLDAFLSALMKDEGASVNEYIHSRTLAAILFEGNPRFEAIHYPSVALQGSMNLAIKPEVADAHLTIAGSSVVRIEQVYDYGIYDFRLIRNALGFYDDGTICWDNR